MDKMRYFIIGNLIGFGLLIVGIGLNEAIKHRGQPSSADHATQNPVDFKPVDGTAVDSTANATAAAATGATEAPVVTAEPSENKHENGVNKNEKDKAALLKSKTNNQVSKVDSEENSFSGDKSATIAPAAVKTEKRLVTTRDISKGTILHPGDVELRQVDAKRATKDGLTSFDKALGEKTRIDLVEGEMLQPADLEDH